MDLSNNLKTVLDNINIDVSVVNDKVNEKQNAITNDNKLDYGLVSGAPTVPTSTSQLTNDSGFVTSSVMEDALSGKQDVIDDMNMLDASYVTTDIDPWQGDGQFTVRAAINEVHEEALKALSGVDTVSGALSGKQDAITNDNKLDYSLLSGTPSIPLSTSELVNDSDFQTSTDVANAISGKLDAPSGGTEGQVLTKTANGEEWADAKGGVIDVDDKTTSASFVVDFAGAQIQKYDVDSAISGSLTIQYDNLDIPEGTAPTVELQVPVTGDVSTVNLPADTQVIEMPNTLTGGVYTYHDIVFRAQRDHSDAIKVYANYAYKFNEEIDYLYFMANQSNSAFALNKVDGSENDVNLEISTDKLNWQNYTIGDVITLQNVNDKVYFRGDNDVFSSFDDRTGYRFNLSGDIGAYGSIMTLVSKTGDLNALPEYGNAFGYLFDWQTSLTHAPKLPAKRLTSNCYRYMFRKTSITNIPELPAIELAEQCYFGLFSNCSSLSGRVVLPATTIIDPQNEYKYEKCYYSMFEECPNINDVTIMFTEWGEHDETEYWLYGAASTGTFRCPAALDTTMRNYNRVPEGWTVVNI